MTDVVHVNGIEDLISATPYLLGFTPEDSLVIVALRERDLAYVMRVDLSSMSDLRAAADAFLPTAIENKVTAVMFLVVCPREAQPAGPLPHSDLIDTCVEAFTSVYIDVADAAWIQACQAGEEWHSYLDSERRGTLPDPSGTAIAAATVAHGLVTHSSRADLAATVRAPAAEDQARRSALVREAAAARVKSRAADVQYIKETIAGWPDRKSALTDDEIVRLGLALSDSEVLTACLAYGGDPTFSRDAEALWRELTRECPTPWRAEPALLLAFVAYQRGDGGFASIALEEVEKCIPDHGLATLLGHAIAQGMPPAVLTRLAGEAARDAMQEIFNNRH